MPVPRNLSFRHIETIKDFVFEDFVFELHLDVVFWDLSEM